MLLSQSQFHSYTMSAFSQLVLVIVRTQSKDQTIFSSVPHISQLRFRLLRAFIPVASRDVFFGSCKCVTSAMQTGFCLTIEFTIEIKLPLFRYLKRF